MLGVSWRFLLIVCFRVCCDSLSLNRAFSTFCHASAIVNLISRTLTWLNSPFKFSERTRKLTYYQIFLKAELFDLSSTNLLLNTHTHTYTHICPFILEESFLNLALCRFVFVLCVLWVRLYDLLNLSERYLYRFI